MTGAVLRPTGLAECSAAVAGAAAAGAPAAGPGRWLEVLSHLDPAYGGLSAFVPALSRSLQERTGARFSLAAFCSEQERVPVGQDPRGSASIWPLGHGRWIADAALRDRFAAAVEGCDGVHVHGLWEASARIATGAARRRGKPFVVSAHGMLEPWALAQKAWKKRVYGALVERPAMQAAACLHALTEAEAADFRRFGCTAPIAVIPNAAEAPAQMDRGLIEARFPELAGRRVVLFLGRLHKKKGVARLIEAWASVAAEHRDALLMLAGPGEATYVSELRARAAHGGVTEQVLFAGMLDGAEKWSALARAHVFALPSFSEGLSVATLEALCSGTPVIVSEACHLPEVVTFGCGWQIGTGMETGAEKGADALVGALGESLAATHRERAAMGDNARRLARERFSWDTVSAQFAELYTCVLGGGTPQQLIYLEATR